MTHESRLLSGFRAARRTMHPVWRGMLEPLWRTVAERGEGGAVLPLRWLPPCGDPAAAVERFYRAWRLADFGLLEVADGQGARGILVLREPAAGAGGDPVLMAAFPEIVLREDGPRLLLDSEVVLVAPGGRAARRAVLLDDGGIRSLHLPPTDAQARMIGGFAAAVEQAATAVDLAMATAVGSA